MKSHQVLDRTARFMCWAYVLGGMLAAHCGLNSARNGAPWYAAGLFAVSLLLGVAVAREYTAADERRAAAVRAERAARLRAQQDDAALGWADLERSCCLRAWESHGTEHDTHHCTRKDQAA
ncbi:hypothetical protein [Streptomyces sp. NPDC001816]|uniref:hypothetical protein n=1 Tax=Streptomyces sp. NPDC001816 TaxID=3364612 RepID=UPI0036C982CF